MTTTNTQSQAVPTAQPQRPPARADMRRVIQNPAYAPPGSDESNPEGRAAHPEIRNGHTWVMVGGTVLLVAVASIVVLAIWGLAAAAVVFVFGTALACIANPVMWASVQRDRTHAEETDPPQMSRE